jgi:hypothetical protein
VLQTTHSWKSTLDGLVHTVKSEHWKMRGDHQGELLSERQEQKPEKTKSKGFHSSCKDVLTMQQLLPPIPQYSNHPLHPSNGELQSALENK